MGSVRAIKSRVAGFSLLIGLVLGVLGSIFALAMASLSVGFHYPVIRPLTLPGIPAGLSLSLDVGNLQAETALLEWAIGLITDVLYLTILAGYYLGFAIATFGFIVIVGGMLSTQQDQSVELLRKIIKQRWFQWVAIITVLAAIVVSNPLLVRLVVEVIVILLVGGSILALTGGSAYLIYRRADTPLAVLALYPLLIGIILLPPVGVALALPSLTAGFQSASSFVAIWILDNVFVFGGLNDLIRRSFRLEGLNYFLMWVAIDVALGWIAGGVFLFKRAVTTGTED